MTTHVDVAEPEVINEALIRACLTTADYLPISNEKLEEMKREAEFHEIVALSFSFRNILKIENLVGLTSIVKLSLDNNIIEHIEGIGHLVKLESLDLSFNNIKEIKGLDSLTNLTDLSLCNNSIRKLENLDTLVNLNLLSIGNNQLTSLEELLYLRRFRNLKMLSLSGNPLAKEPEYHAHVIAHLSFSDFQSGGHLAYLDYRLVETAAVTTAREQFQDKLLELNDQEKLEADALEKKKERDESIVALKKLGLDAMDEFVNDLFEQDSEKEKLNMLSSWNDAADEIRMEYKNMIEPIIQNRRPMVQNKADELAAFQSSMSTTRGKSVQASMALIHKFSKRMKGLVALIDKEEIDSAEALAKLQDARRGLGDVCADLCELQLRQQEVEVGLIATFESRYGEFMKAILGDTTALFENLRERLSMLYQKVLENALEEVEKVTALQAAEAAKGGGGGGGGGGSSAGGRRGSTVNYNREAPAAGDSAYSDDQLSFLRDREAVLGAINASREALMAAVDAKETALSTREKEESQRLVKEAADESAARDRQRTGEIVALRRENERLIRALEGEENL